MKRSLQIIVVFVLCFSAARTVAAPVAVTGFKKDSDGITLQTQPGVLRLDVYSPRVIRVTYAVGEKPPSDRSLCVIEKPGRVSWKVSETQTGQPKEMWRFDANTKNILIRYDQLRYHLISYIYSVAWMVTHGGYTMMRPLVMDFQSDTNGYNISDQYLFGPALMVCPVTHPGVANRNVYLPAGARWVDFWTGKGFAGGQTIDVAAPIETEPLFVRVGSILPYGPAIQYATQTNDPIELRVYRGANGRFTLYEDENDNYNYEKGKYATIPISWDEASHTLEIGKRKGDFPGMLKRRTFNIIWISDGHGVGISSTDRPDAVVHYHGAAIKISGPQ